MMIAGFTPDSLFTSFRDPLDEPYQKLTFINLGGVNIGDGSQGREVKRWIGTYSGSTISVAPEDGPVQFTLVRPGVTTLSFSFDTNMAIAVAYMDASGAHMHFFNSLLGAYDTLTVATATSCQTCMDDPREFAQANSDVIFAYVRAGNLYYRQQRDRYTIERLIGTAAGKQILRCGQTNDFRCAFKLGPQP